MTSYHSRVADVSDKVHNFFRDAFDAVFVNGPSLDIAELNSSSLMIPCTHRSHIDYFVLGKVIYELGLQNMRFAAGDNLTQLPIIGKKFRSFGAFTVKRGKSLERTYLKQLCEQVVEMLMQKEKIIVFPEGGRSYSGKMLEIKTGILGALAIAQARNPAEKFYLLPAAVSYEKVPEVMYFKSLLKGKELRKCKKRPLARMKGQLLYFGSDIFAFAKLLAARHFGRKCGSVYVDYGEAIGVNEIVDLEALVDRNAKYELSAHRRAIHQISNIVKEKFYSLFRILPVHIMASLLCRRNEITFKQAEEMVAPLVNELSSKGRNVKQLTALQNQQIIEEGVEQLARNKVICLSGSTLSLKDRQIAEYYAAALL